MVKKKTAERIGRIAPFHIFAGFLIAILAILLVFNYISLNEISSDINKAKKTLSKIESDVGLLNVQIEKKNSLDNIEVLAVEMLGMKKIESYQIQRVNLVAGDTVQVAADTDAEKGEGLFEGIAASFNILVEYLR